MLLHQFCILFTSLYVDVRKVSPFICYTAFTRSCADTGLVHNHKYILIAIYYISCLQIIRHDNNLGHYPIAMYCIYLQACNLSFKRPQTANFLAPQPNADSLDPFRRGVINSMLTWSVPQLTPVARLLTRTFFLRLSSYGKGWHKRLQP